MQRIGVLKLINQDVAKARVVMLAQGLEFRQHFVRAKQQFRKINDTFALTGRFVELIKLNLLSREIVERFHRVRSQPFFLRAGDKPHQLLRRKFFVVDVVGFEDALDQRQLILRVHDGERLRQIGFAPVHAQKAIAQSMKGADPHGAHIHWHHR